MKQRTNSEGGAGTEPVDPAVIAQLATITDGAGASVLAELVDAFLATAPTRVRGLDAAVASGDRAAVAHSAHALAGSAASFGARAMAARCRQLWATAERGNLEAAKPLLRDLHVELDRVRASLLEMTRPVA